MSSLWVGSVGSVSALCILYLTLVIDASKFIFNILCFSIYNPLKDLQGTHSGHYYPLFKDTRLGDHTTTSVVWLSFLSSDGPPEGCWEALFLFIHRKGRGILFWPRYSHVSKHSYHSLWGNSRGCMTGVCISHPGDDRGNTSRSICSSLPHHFSPESQPKPRQLWALAGSFCSLICHPMDPVDQNPSPFLQVQFSLSSRPNFRNTHPWAFSPLCPHDQRGVQFSSILAISIE